MGCPDIYYERALKNLCYFLDCHTNKELAKKLYEEKDIKVLEEHILEKKETLPEKDFFYNAGMASMYTLNKANAFDGCDGFNACLDGLSRFGNFIGLIDEEDEE